MKKKIFIAVLAFISLSLTTVAQSNGINVKSNMQKSFSVKGGAGIGQFFTALWPGIGESDMECPVKVSPNNINGFTMDCPVIVSPDEPVGSIFDKKNGYARYYTGRPNIPQVECCYWNRKDGTKLVAFYYDKHEISDDGSEKTTSFLQFYTYNATTKCLDPINLPIGKDLSGPGHLIVELPRYNKDIKYHFGIEQDMDYSVLKWNGWDFRTDVAKTSTLQAGVHKLRLQWIEGVDFGSCKIAKDGQTGWYTISGSHYNKDKTDWLKIEGRLKLMDSRRLYFEGTIKTKVSYIANGEEQIRRGNMDFYSSGSRKYWRLQQMFNPRDNCVDYVDIFF